MDLIEKYVLARDPYLWLDDVVQIDNDHLHARKFLDPDLPIFQAHYIDFPLFPGALQCEAAFQAAAVLIGYSQPTREGHVPVIARVRNVKFRQLVRPGDTLDIHLQRRDVVSTAISLSARIEVAGKTTTELEFVATEAKLPTESPQATA